MLTYLTLVGKLHRRTSKFRKTMLFFFITNANSTQL